MGYLLNKEKKIFRKICYFLIRISIDGYYFAKFTIVELKQDLRVLLNQIKKNKKKKNYKNKLYRLKRIKGKRYQYRKAINMR